MKIEKIEKLKNGKYKIIVNGEEITTYDDLILKYGILFKKDIDSNLYNNIIKENNYYDIYNDALKFAMKKMRSKKEMSDYLKKSELALDEQKDILDKLINVGVVNDLMFTRAYINDKVLLSKEGIGKIKKGLITNGIDSSIIEKEIANIDEKEMYNKLYKLVTKKLNSNHKYSNTILKNKIINEMIELGYNKDDIISILDNNVIDDYDILLKEYNKVYTRYSKKLSGCDLENKIRQILYSKGFKYENIKKEDLI